MKGTTATVLKVLAVLAAIAAIVFVIVAYGEQIKSWFQRMIAKFTKTGISDFDCDCECVEADFAG